MKVKKFLLLIVISILMTLVACSNDKKEDESLDEEALENLNESAMPIVKEPINLKMFTGKSAQNVDSDWNDILMWNEYEDRTNIMGASTNRFIRGKKKFGISERKSTRCFLFSTIT